MVKECPFCGKKAGIGTTKANTFKAGLIIMLVSFFLLFIPIINFFAGFFMLGGFGMLFIAIIIPNTTFKCGECKREWDSDGNELKD